MSTMGSTGAGDSGGAGGQSTGGGQASTGAGFSSTGSGASSSGTGGSTFTSSAGSTASVAFKWGDGWRDQIAGGDAKILQRLGRFATPEDMWRSYTALEARMSSGEIKSGKPKDATPEQLTQWRKENGIPEKPADYDLKFDNGLVIGEEDKPVIDAFIEVAHKNDLPPSAVKEAVAWYYAAAEKQTEDRAAADLKAAQETTDTLRAKFGNEYRPNINAMHSLLDLAPAGLKDSLLHGRLADGTPIGSAPAAIEWLVGLARQLNPVGTVVPAGTVNPGQAIEAEISKYESMLGNRNSEYWKGDKAQWHQNRYKELIEAKTAMTAQGKK